MSNQPIRITGPADLVALVPYLLGFTPADSLVLIGLGAGRVQVTARIDLTDIMGEQSTAAQGLAHTMTAILRSASADVVAVSYGPTPVPVALVADAAEQAGLRVSEQLHVTGGSYRSLTCDDPTCCPPADLPVVGAVEVAAVVAGLAAAPTRDALADDIRRAGECDPLLVELIGAATSNAEAAIRLDRLRYETGALRRVRAATRAIAAGQTLDTAALAHVAVALTIVAVRDRVWMDTDTGAFDIAPLARHLVRVLPDTHRAAPLFLVAWTAWRAGHGARASIALDEIDRITDRYTAAELLRQALTAGLDPRTTPPLSV